MKKLLSLFIMAVMILTTAVPAFAQPAAGLGLERAIVKVKSIIDIPETASIFESGSWDDPETGRVWNLTWTSPDYEQYFSVSITDSGVILSFSSHITRDTGIIGGLTREDGRKSAEEFLRKALPEKMSDFRLVDGRSFDWAFSFTYRVFINDIPVNNMTLNIDVDKHNGRVMNYFGHNFAGDRDVFPVPGEVVGAEKGLAAFAGSDGISLIYNSSFDYQTRELNIFPSYVLNSNKFIDAASGEVLDGYMDFGRAYGGARAEAVVSDSAEEDAGLTPEEQRLVDVMAGLISRETAVRSALSLLSWLPSSSSPQSSSLSSMYYDREKYVWYLNFENFSASVDAKSRELLSFYSYSSSDGRESRVISEDAARRTAVEFARKAAGNKFDSVVLDESSVRRMGHSFFFTRNVNGTPFPGNYISVSVDPVSGRIAHYDLVWFDNAVFPDLSEAISAEEALEVFAGEDSFDLLYTRVAEDKIAVVYGFIEGPFFLVDPFTGTKLGHDGKPYRDVRAVDSYEDIAGKWYEQVVNTLLDNGYFLDGDAFEGGKQITQEEFLRYMHSPFQAHYSSDDFYEMLIRNNVINEGEKAPGSIISRQDAAKFAIRFLGLDKAAKDGSIFRNVFSDAVSGDYLGYAALARALGIMQGDAAGNFNGGREMTRAEAAVVVFNLLKAI